jgi:hypothetical protein
MLAVCQTQVHECAIHPHGASNREGETAAVAEPDRRRAHGTDAAESVQRSRFLPAGCSAVGRRRPRHTASCYAHEVATLIVARRRTEASG